MGKIVFTFISCILILNLYAQKQGQERVDSLLIQLPKEKEDSNKAILLVDLSYSYSSIAPDKGIEYGQQALHVTENLNWGKGIIESNKVIGINYFNKSDYSEAIKYYDEGLRFAENQNYKLGIAEIMSRYGIIYREQSNYPKALEYDSRALKMSEEIDNKNEKANILWNMGNVYAEQSFFIKAFELLDSALGLYIKLNNKEGEGSVLNDIGNTYFLQKDYFNALENFNKALEINEKFGFKRGIATSFIGKGVCYGDQGYLIKGLEFEVNSLKITEELGYKRDIILGLGNTGEYYLKIAKDTADKIRPDSIRNKATILSKAIIYLKKSIEISKETELLNAMQYFSRDLSEAQELAGNYKDALESYKQHSLVQDSIFSIESKRKIAELEAKHEIDIKQKEIEILNKDKEIQASEIRRQTFIKRAILIGAIMLVIFSLLLERSYNHRRKVAFDKERVIELNRLIEKQKIELENQVAERTGELNQSLKDLKSTQKQLIQSEKLASLGELTAGIAHEIQNPLNFVNNFSEVNKELLVEMKDEIKNGNIDEANAIADDIIENEEKILHHGNRADAIVKSMLQHSKSSSGQKEPTNINTLADEYLRLSYHGLRAKDKSFNAILKTDFDDSIDKINIIPQDIGRVLLNLYNNAFYTVSEKKKTADAGYDPTVSVSTKKIGDKVEVRVKDNGNGIAQKVIDKIFQPFFTTKPTGEGTGLGLSLSYDIVKAHGGEIKVETKQNEGSEFKIELPASV